MPICEIRQLPNWDVVVHYVMDPEAQKLIESFHRYGMQKPLPHNPCPFKDGSLRNRFTTLIGQNNVMTVYEEQSQDYRRTIMAYFKHQKLEELKIKWKEFTKEWLCQQITQDNVNLFDASLLLIGKCLIKGMLGYKECSDADITFNTEFWKNLFKLSPEEMKSLKELEAQGKPPQPTIMRKLLEYSWSICSSWVQKAYMYFSPSIDTLHQLAQKIYKSTVGDTQSLCGYLASQGWEEQKIVENVKIFMIAGQETVGYFLGFMLYEYASNRQMQEKHAAATDEIEKAFVETLRLYSLGGSLREARYDMVLSYPNTQGTLNHHFIRKGERINCAPYLSGHDARQWIHPEQFNPDRLQLEKVKKNPHFGYGQHRCIGEKSAHRELIAIVEEVLSNTRLMTKEKMPELLDTFTFRPIHDVKVRFDVEYMSLEYASIKDVPVHLRDHNIYLTCVKKNASELRNVPEEHRDTEIYLAAIRQHGRWLFNVPDKVKTAEMCMEAVSKYGLALEAVPEAMRTSKICRTAVAQNGLALEFVPESERSEEICRIALKHNSMALQFVPTGLKTYDLCLEAVNKCGYALKYVPEEMKTDEMCMAAVSSIGLALEYVPEKKRSPAICQMAVRKDPFAMQYVPDEVATPEFCLDAVKHKGFALYFIKASKQTSEICLEAVKRHGTVLKYVRKDLLTEEICLAAVTDWGLALSDVPDIYKTPKVCMAAVQRDGVAFDSVPEMLKSPEICLAAVNEYGLALEHVPVNLRTLEICKAALKQNPLALQFVPEALKTAEMCYEVVRRCGRALRFVPETMKTMDICMAAVKKDPWAIFYVPKEKRTPELCLIAVKGHGGTLRLVPKDKRTQEICLAAVKGYGEAIRFVPMQHKKPALYIWSNRKKDKNYLMDDMIRYMRSGEPTVIVDPRIRMQFLTSR